MATRFTYWMHNSPDTEGCHSAQLTRAQFAALVKVAKPIGKFSGWTRDYELPLGMRLRLTYSPEHVQAYGEFAEWSDHDLRVEWREIDDVESAWAQKVYAEKKRRGL